MIDGVNENPGGDDVPEISVIMAAYNAEDYLLESVNSILNQDFKDFELIICDDASTDSTWKKICLAMKMDERIIGIKNETNLKAAASRNNCIDIARGEYIAIQDSDDISEPNRLSKQIEALKKESDFSFIGTGMYLFAEKGIWNRTTPVQYPTKYDYLQGAPFAHGTTMFKKDVIQDVEGYRVAKETERGQDADLFMRLKSKGYNGMNLLDQLYGYRVDEN